MIKIGKDISSFSAYSFQPKTNEELFHLIRDRIYKEGPYCDLNDIDTSLIDDMSYLFSYSDFNGNISDWDVSNVKSMDYIFYYSDFNQDISKWDTSNVITMRGMFMNSKFNGNLSKWNVSKVKYMYKMFVFSAFDQDISNWKIRKNCGTVFMFHSCSIRDEFKPKVLQK